MTALSFAYALLRLALIYLYICEINPKGINVYRDGLGAWRQGSIVRVECLRGLPSMLTVPCYKCLIPSWQMLLLMRGPVRLVVS